MAVPPSGAPQNASATRAGQRTIGRVSVLKVSRGPETSSTPSTSLVARSVMGAECEL